MKYPLIYSLSTVGILKHYNQDYLIHEQRTDFTGANGVGKSIIADLFQLIFVNDRQLFQFGTEGYKKDGRQIHKLPHRCSEAYAFLTVELDVGKFICIGVCIPNTTNRAIKPFMISADPDPQRKLIDKAFSTQQLPMASHFVNQRKQISAIDEVSKRFRDEYGLYFEHFSQAEQKDAHFARLFDQGLIPVNLSVPSSRKAFAKIIQSFSRARSGGDKSEDLKDFLFDGVEKYLEQSFDVHKAEIDKILSQFEQLQAYIADLEQKQLQLESLSSLDALTGQARKDFLFAECGNLFYNHNKAKAGFEGKKADHYAASLRADALELKLPKLQTIAAAYALMEQNSQQRLEQIIQIQKQLETSAELKLRIENLAFAESQNISEVLLGSQAIDDYGDQELIRRFEAFIPVYQQYESIQAIEETLSKQKELIANRLSALKAEISYHELVERLFTGAQEQTLIARVISSDEHISQAQEAVLFHFLKTYWGIPGGPEYPYYASGYDFFNNEHILENRHTGGYWLALGDLFIAIPPLQHEPVLTDPKLRRMAIADLVEQQKLLIGKAKLEAAQLEQFQKGNRFDLNYAPILTGMDERLYDFAKLKDFEITGQLALQVDAKIQALRTSWQLLESEVSAALKVLGIEVTADIASFIAQQEYNLGLWKTRANRFSTRAIEDSASLKALQDTSLPALSQQVEERARQSSQAELAYLTSRNALDDRYPELIAEVLPLVNEEAVSQLREKYDQATVAYKSSFRSACELFAETRLGSNVEITADLKNERYNFSLLERVLLGKIRFREQITEELRQSNASRYKLIESIHETMLKIFITTKNKFEEYRSQIRDLNLFFKGRRISNKYFFQVEFKPSADIPIEWINQLQAQSHSLYGRNELPMGQPVENFIEEFFKMACNYKKKIAFRDLLDPKTYFTLDAGLSDEQGKEISGSTGETYSAKVLLGIGRLSKVQSQNRDGIRFIILEETANLDKTNFNNFPAIAEEFGYQIITMTPKPFGADATTGWYLHHLLPGKQDPDINYPLPASYFKTNTGREELVVYLKRKQQ